MGGYKNWFTNSPTHHHSSICFTVMPGMMLVPHRRPTHALPAPCWVCGTDPIAPVRCDAAHAPMASPLREEVGSSSLWWGPMRPSRSACNSERSDPHSPGGGVSIGGGEKRYASTAVTQAVVVVEASLQREKLGGGVLPPSVHRGIGGHVDVTMEAQKCAEVSAQRLSGSRPVSFFDAEIGHHHSFSFKMDRLAGTTHPNLGISHTNRDSTCLNGPVKARVTQYQYAQRMVDASSNGCAGRLITTLEAWTEVVFSTLIYVKWA